MEYHVGVHKVPCQLSDDQFLFIINEYNEGASDEEIKAYIWEQRGSFSNDLWDRWLKEEEAFAETIKKGRALSRRWWEKSGRANLKDKDFSPTLWYMNMRNRFGWADKTLVEQNGSVRHEHSVSDNDKALINQFIKENKNEL